MTRAGEFAPRVLEFSRDPLFASVDHSRADWVRTGRRLEPAGRAGLDVIAPTSMIAVIGRVLRRRYDLIIFPAIRLTVPGDTKNTRKRSARRALVLLSRNPITPRLIRILFGLSKVDYMVRDVGDFPELEEVSTNLFPEARVYLKREVLSDDLSRPLSANIPVVYTPMPFDLSYYPPPVKSEKSVDVFYAARPYGQHRREARATLERLRNRGITVDIPEERIPFEEYLHRLSRSHLVVSPRGQGEHCYRHYEALLMGSVPVINEPVKPVHYDLAHGETALFYAPDELESVIRSALANPERLQRIAAAGASLVRSKHAKPAICRQILSWLAPVPG